MQNIARVAPNYVIEGPLIHFWLHYIKILVQLNLDEIEYPNYLLLLLDILML